MFDFVVLAAPRSLRGLSDFHGVSSMLGDGREDLAVRAGSTGAVFGLIGQTEVVPVVSSLGSPPLAGGQRPAAHHLERCVSARSMRVRLRGGVESLRVSQPAAYLHDTCIVSPKTRLYWKDNNCADFVAGGDRRRTALGYLARRRPFMWQSGAGVGRRHTPRLRTSCR